MSCRRMNRGVVTGVKVLVCLGVKAGRAGAGRGWREADLWGHTGAQDMTLTSVGRRQGLTTSSNCVRQLPEGYTPQSKGLEEGGGTGRASWRRWHLG